MNARKGSWGNLVLEKEGSRASRVLVLENVDAHCGYEFVKPTGTALRALSRAAERADWPAYDTAALLRRQHTSNDAWLRTAVATAAPATAPTSATST